MAKLRRTGHLVSVNALLLHHLHLRLGTPQVQVIVPHTLICSRGKVTTWLFTSKDGVVLSKRKKHQDLYRFVATIIRIARQRKTTIVCVAKSYLESEARFRVELLTEIQLLDFLESSKDRLPLTLVSLQAYVARQNHNATYISSFSTTEHGKTGGVYSRRLVISKRKLGATSLIAAGYETKLRQLLSSEERSQKVYCKRKEVFLPVRTLMKERLSLITKLLVCYLEKNNKVNIHSLNVEYVQDEEGCFNITHIWKVVSSTASTALAKEDHRTYDKTKTTSKQTENEWNERLQLILQGPRRGEKQKHPNCWGEYCTLGKVAPEQPLHNRVLLKSIVFAHLNNVEVNVQSKEESCESNTCCLRNLEILTRSQGASTRNMPKNVRLQDLTCSVPVCINCLQVYSVVEARAIETSSAYVSTTRNAGIRIRNDLRISNPMIVPGHTSANQEGSKKEKRDRNKLSCSFSDSRHSRDSPIKSCVSSPPQARETRASTKTSANLRRDLLYNRLSTALHCDQSPPLLPLRTGSYYH